MNCPRPLRWILGVATIPLQTLVVLLTHVQISPQARVGGGLYLPHLGPIVVGSGASVGCNCTLCHGVTIGHALGRNKVGSPRVGDRVYIGPGAIIIGPVDIADDVLIGAGAVVVKSLPARSVVAGNPARIVGQSGSFQLIDYPGKENDHVRLASLAKSTPVGLECTDLKLLPSCKRSDTWMSASVGSPGETDKQCL